MRAQMKLAGIETVKLFFFAGIYTIVGYFIPLQQDALTLTYLIGTAITGLLYAVLLRHILHSMTIGARGRFFSIWIAIWIVQMFNPLLEGIFFTDQLIGFTIVFGAVIFGMILPIIYTASAVILFKPENGDSSLRQRLREHFRKRRASEWGWRIAIASLSWTIIYFVFGNLVAPWVMPYYSDPNSGFNLVIPSLAELLALQTVRGFIYVVSLIPLAISINVDFRRAFTTIASLLFIGGGLAIFLIVETFPLALRLFHSVDLLADSIFFGYVFSYLLVRE
jgi:hypothetical protein